MKERPILFSAPMVQAIIEGRKLMTRRVMKVQPYMSEYETDLFHMTYKDKKGHIFCASGKKEMYLQFCPYGQPGDRLWVRESYWVDKITRKFKWYVNNIFTIDRVRDNCCMRPSIFMPRDLSRITIEITNVRVELLQTISDKDAISEGIELYPCDCFGPEDIHEKCPNSEWGTHFRDYSENESEKISCVKPGFSFMTLWQSINGPGSWQANPWVWVIEFKRVEK